MARSPFFRRCGILSKITCPAPGTILIPRTSICRSLPGTTAWLMTKKKLTDITSVRGGEVMVFPDMMRKETGTASILAFKDSHNKWQPIGGYGWEKIWQPMNDKDFRLGLGYTAAVTARDDYKYIPIPIVLPLASVGYDKLTFQATYIPGTHNNGNVFFAWLRYQF